MREILNLKTRRKLLNKNRYRLRRKKNKVKLKSIYEIYSGDVMNPYFNMYELAEAIWANCNIKEFPEKRKKVEQTKAISIIPVILLVVIFKLKNTINNSVIKHLKEEFSKKTIAIINYISILFSINNYKILS